MKKSKKNLSQLGLSSPNKVKLHFAFDYRQDEAWMSGFAELPSLYFILYLHKHVKTTSSACYT